MFFFALFIANLPHRLFFWKLTVKLIMHRSLSLLVVFFLSISVAQSQSLYLPRDVKAAYTKGTRSPDGNPGKNYWQNSASYDINLKVVPSERTVLGKERIRYVNNSPDTLKTIVLKLILNNHKPESARYGYTSEKYLTEGITIDELLVNGKKGLWKDGMGISTCQDLPLSQPLLPGDSLTMDVNWHYSISLQSGREGMIDATTWYLAYFYPRIAVYDDYNGWDRVEHTGGPEFYNDFNEYALHVEVPDNFVVWGTGDLLNSSNVLQPLIYQRLKHSMISDSVIHIATRQEMDAKNVTSHHPVNVWEFRASNVTDVALGISDHFVWDGASAVVDSTTGRRASMQAAYADTTFAFKHMVHDGAFALNWYSHHIPGVPYPFPKMTAFQGNADMEYPMMINDSPISGLNGRRVANHEIAHTWFPFYMGTNETRYAFMDEAWATTLELLIAASYTDKAQAEETFRKGRIEKWATNPAQTTDLPIITPSYELKEAYRTNAYGKPSLAYQALRDLLGNDSFLRCLHAYMSRWHSKHPIPWDFFYTFNSVSGLDLNWFWNNWFFSNHYIDLAVNSVTKTSAGYKVIIDNVGGFAIPFNVQVDYTDGSHSSIHYTPSIWKTSGEKAVVELNGKKPVRALRLMTGIFVDASPANNEWRVSI